MRIVNERANVRIDVSIDLALASSDAHRLDGRRCRRDVVESGKCVFGERQRCREQRATQRRAGDSALALHSRADGAAHRASGQRCLQQTGGRRNRNRSGFAVGMLFVTTKIGS